MKTTNKSYVLIYFKDKKPIKKAGYETASKAFYDYEDKGCILVQLFNERGVLLSSAKFTEKISSLYNN